MITVFERDIFLERSGIDSFPIAIFHERVRRGSRK